MGHIPATPNELAAAKFRLGSDAKPLDVYVHIKKRRAPRIVKTIAKQQSSAIILDDKAQLLADIEFLKTQIGRMTLALDRVYNKALQLTVKE